MLAVVDFFAAAVAASPVHLDVAAGTDFPATVGVKATVETPQRLRFSAGVGTMPRAYLNTIQGIAVGAGWYSEGLANVIDTALDRARVLHFQAGYRPIAAKGFYFGAGFMPVLAQGGDATAADLESAGQEGDSDYAIQSRLQMLSVHAGWEWFFFDERLVLRGTLGGAFTAGASTVAEPLTESGFERAQDVGVEVIEQLLDNTYQSYVHTPTVGLELGCRFF